MAQNKLSCDVSTSEASLPENYPAVETKYQIDFSFTQQRSYETHKLDYVVLIYMCAMLIFRYGYHDLMIRHFPGLFDAFLQTKFWAPVPSLLCLPRSVWLCTELIQDHIILIAHEEGTSNNSSLKQSLWTSFWVVTSIIPGGGLQPEESRAKFVYIPKPTVLPYKQKMMPCCACWQELPPNLLHNYDFRNRGKSVTWTGVRLMQIRSYAPFRLMHTQERPLLSILVIHMRLHLHKNRHIVSDEQECQMKNCNIDSVCKHSNNADVDAK